MEDRLQKFRTLVEVGSFTAAAQALHISQPALTMAVAKLERELGTGLLIHGERGVDLTEAGYIAYQAACDQYTLQKNLRNALAEQAGKRVELSIGMIDSVAATIGDAPGILEQIELVADIEMIVNNSRVLLEAVAERQLDGAFVVAPSKLPASVLARPVGTEQLVAVCAPTLHQRANHEASMGRITQFISYNKGSRTHELVEAALRSSKIRSRARFFSTSPDVMLRLVIAGRGVAVLPYSLVCAHLDAGALQAITRDGIPVTVERPIQFITHKGINLPSIAEGLVQDIAALLQGYAEPNQ